MTDVMSGGKSAGKKCLFGIDHIVMVAEGFQETTFVKLVNGEKLNVIEPYDGVKRLLDPKNA